MAWLDVTEVFANIRLPGHLHTESSLHFASDFEFQDTDVLLVTYPKSGTTWMQEILTLIYSNGNLQPIKTLPNWARAPRLEHTYFQEQLQHIGCPLPLTTHLPQSVLTPALKKAKPKVIYVANQYPGLDHPVHPFQPADWMLVTTTSLDQQWKGLFQMLQTTHTALKVEGLASWIDHFQSEEIPTICPS
ncbi:PREDICTED: 3-alpha-hydroxysteroid sulfotransferase-like [Thamnophis sirtalis]|uniref:Sulfotransferase n=1 Tax=Thamnophis sirtalis TaxID=35019 RepID=A0A6I9Z3T2_9SAUR|nr:PREDICTED: 3-alpha-hydroxysteroid sulfotransferase-like [Thamnophis sirtalis]